jgi:hypothetical protein
MNEDQAAAGPEPTCANLFLQGQQRFAGVQRFQRHTGLCFGFADEGEQLRVGSSEAATAGLM